MSRAKYGALGIVIPGAPYFSFESDRDGEVDQSTSSAAAVGDKAILVASFGSSHNDSRDITIGAIESAIRKNFPGYEIRRAFTAQVVINKIARRDGVKIDNVTQALDRLVADGCKTLIVQPTHLMGGFHYRDLMAEVQKYRYRFDEIGIGDPLLSSDDDFAAVVKAITERTAFYVDDDTAVVFMGHGTEHSMVCATLQEKFAPAGHSHYFVGTVEATPALTDLIASVKAAGYTKVVLEPLMVVAGDHANNDMAGVGADSWEKTFQAEGFDVLCILQGLGQFSAIQDIYVEHVRTAIESVR